MHDPLRLYIHDSVLKKYIKPYSKLKKNKKILEIGCGNGAFTKLIIKYFDPDKIIATDFDERLISYADKKYANSRVVFSQEDGENLSFQDNEFDAVIFNGVIHHIINWQKALQELKRVLKPGGELMCKEASTDTFKSTLFGRLMKKLTAHPYSQMYTAKGFIDYLQISGFEIVNYQKIKQIGLLNNFICVARLNIDE